VTDVFNEYCRAWNAADLDGIFALFSEDAVYAGASRTLRGRQAIRQMYATGFAHESIRSLTAVPATLRDGTIGIVLQRGETVVALKRFRFGEDQIVWHDITEDATSIGELLDLSALSEHQEPAT